MDEYYSDPKAPFYQTVANDRIKFHDDNDPDPDWIVKQCYLLLLAAAWEGDIGVENLWKKGQSGGRHNYANFGQYVPQNVFKAWQNAAAYMFADKKYWYQDRRNMNWDVFLPVLDGFNNKRKDLFQVILLILDESMSGWRPKTSKTGGLPNISFEPRKPVPLGTMFQNACECFTGCLVYQDVAQNVEEQQRKPYFFVDGDADRKEQVLSHLPVKTPMQAHSAEVLRQADGAGVIEGGWVGGDAWVWVCNDMCRTNEEEESPLDVRCEGTQLPLSASCASFSSGSKARGASCRSLGNNDSHNQRRPDYCTCLCMESKGSLLLCLDVWQY